MTNEPSLSRRERQILDVLHARGQATSAEVHGALPDAPGYSAVRALLRILEQKGHAKHRRDGLRYVYLPKESRAQASRARKARPAGSGLTTPRLKCAGIPVRLSASSRKD